MIFAFFSFEKKKLLSSVIRHPYPYHCMTISLDLNTHKNKSVVFWFLLWACILPANSSTKRLSWLRMIRNWRSNGTSAYLISFDWTFYIAFPPSFMISSHILAVVTQHRKRCQAIIYYYDYYHYPYYDKWNSWTLLHFHSILCRPSSTANDILFK